MPDEIALMFIGFLLGYFGRNIGDFVGKGLSNKKSEEVKK